jgi:hypothetical protein
MLPLQSTIVIKHQVRWAAWRVMPNYLQLVVKREAGLSHAIDKGLSTKPATRVEVFHVLSSGQ